MVAALVGVQNSARKPLVTVDTTLPTGWDNTPDATPVDSAALVTALSNVVQNGGAPYVIELTAGTTYTGTFVVENKTGTEWLIIRSSGWTGTPPVAEGTRVLPADASNMATIEQTGSVACLRMDFGAHNIRLIGVEFTVAVDVIVFNLVGFDNTNASPAVKADLAKDVTYDRCLIASSSTVNGCETGIQINCNNFACIDSYIHNIKQTSDAQTILIRLGTGIEIRNCFLEATGENILLGGNDNLILNGIPEDVTISKCHIFKRNEWNPDHPSYGGINWNVKNLFEVKMGRRIYLHSCVLEHNWLDNQNGTAILITVRNQGGTNPWSVIEDMVIENCKVFRIGRLFLALSDDDGSRSRQCQRFRFRNNLVFTNGGNETDTEDFGTSGKGFKFTKKVGGRTYQDVEISHNTFVYQEGHLGGIFVTGETATSNADNLRILNNIWDDGEFSFKTPVDQTATGKLTNVTISGNGIFFNDGANNVTFRRDNFSTHFPNDTKADTETDVKFTDAANQDYTLQGGASPSPFKGAADDGRDCGVGFVEFNAAIAGVV